MKYVTLQHLPEEAVSHNPEIRKRVMLRKGDLCHLTNFSQARFKPGQVAPGHRHEAMHEVFLVEAGSGVITIDGADYALKPGVCVTVEAGEFHEVRSAPDDELVLTYFGIQF